MSYSKNSSKNSKKVTKNTKKTQKNATKQENMIQKAQNLTQKAKSATKGFKFSLARLVVFLIVAVITISAGYLFKTPIEDMLNKQVKANADLSMIDENGLSVHFIDVGQGDAIAIKFPDGKKMLIDSGKSQSKDKLIDYLCNVFFEGEDRVFDFLLLTHCDADHCGGMVAVCENFVINKIYRPYQYSKYTKDGVVVFDETNGNLSNKNVCETLTYYKTIKAFNSEIAEGGENATIVMTDITVCNSTQKIEGEGYYFDFYAPTSTYITTSAGTVENDASPIMCLNYNGKKIMFTGDASITSEELAMARATLPDVDLLKVGHHGSATSSGQAFLNQIKPEISVICVGEGNSYHHPTNEALNRLASVGSTVFRTDKNGTIVANITSGVDAEINMYVGVVNDGGIYIRVEYLMAGIIILSLGLCFGVKIKL